VIILDTNVISELIAPAVSLPVEAWLSRQASDDLWVTSFTVSEMFYGAFKLDEGKKRQALEAAIAGILFDDFEGRILPFDDEAAMCHADLHARLRREGHPTQDSDALIASIALAADAAIATRNLKHFQHCGVDLINPWTA
jgi:predicted nucleic acid-binding protein